MKNKTYNILTRIPIVSTIVKHGICDSSMFCSPMLHEGLDPKIYNYMSDHPGEVITRKMVKTIMNSK